MHKIYGLRRQKILIWLAKQGSYFDYHCVLLVTEIGLSIKPYNSPAAMSARVQAVPETAEVSFTR